MADDRFLVLGYARARTEWFGELSRWANAALVPVEFLKCVSLEEVRSRLSTGRRYSALLLDGSAPGVDRDLILAAAQRCPVLVVDDGRTQRDWEALGAAVVLAAPLAQRTLMDALRSVALPAGQPGAERPSETPGTHRWRGSVVSVCGTGGSGSSTVAIAAAQALAERPGSTGLVALADLCLDADLALYHDADEVAPGLAEMVEGHRSGELPVAEIRSLLHRDPIRGYDLLLGLRRHRDWTTLRPRSVEAALDGLRRSYRVVVCDVDADLEGELDTGSVDVEERNALARTALGCAQAVLLVAGPSLRELRGILRIAHRVNDHGVDPTQVLLVVNRAPRHPRARAEIAAVLQELSPAGAVFAAPLFLPERRQVESVHRDAAALPHALTRPLLEPLNTLLEVGAATGEMGAAPVPVRVGSLGTLGVDRSDGLADSDGRWR